MRDYRSTFKIIGTFAACGTGTQESCRARTATRPCCSSSYYECGGTPTTSADTAAASASGSASGTGTGTAIVSTVTAAEWPAAATSAATAKGISASGKI